MRGLRHAFRICQQRDSEWRDERLEAEELLQRLLVCRSAAFRVKSDLVDADRFGPIIRPEVRVDLEARRLPLAQEQLLGERPRDGRLADRLLAGEAVGMCQAAGSLVSPQDRDGSVMPGDRGKASRHNCRASTSASGWHGAHLNKSFLDRARTHSYSVGVSDSVAVNFVGIVAFCRRQSQFTSQH